MSLRTGLFNGLTRETEPLREIDFKKMKKKKIGERDGTAGLPNKCNDKENMQNSLHVNKTTLAVFFLSFFRNFRKLSSSISVRKHKILLVYRQKCDRQKCQVAHFPVN